MPVSSLASVADLVRRCGIRYRRADFVTPVATTLSGPFRSEIDFTLTQVPFDASDAAACETLIYPFLRESWKPFSAALTPWSHLPIDLGGGPGEVADYLITRRSRLGISIFEPRILLVVETAKEEGSDPWARCLAKMIAAREVHGPPDRTIYGITTNGSLWFFGRLGGGEFTEQALPFGTSNLDAIASALHFLMIQCRDQAARLAVPA